MESGPTRIALQRKTVSHSYNRNRRLQISSSGSSGIRSPNTNNQDHGIPRPNNQQPMPDFPKRVLAQGANSSIPSMVEMTGHGGAVYTADVRIGSEWYNLIVDTGSSDTWVSCYVYDSTSCLPECPRAAVSITYGSGLVCVSTEYLTIKVGTLQKQNYAVGIALNPIVKPGTDKQGGILLGQSQGILGLGYPKLASFTSPVGYLVQFVTSFSVYLAPNDAPFGSFLTLNGVDDDVITENRLVPYRLPLKEKAEPTHWTVGLTGFHVDGYRDTIVPCKPLTSGTCDAIIDTGTTMLVVPPQVFDTLVTKVLVPAGCYESQQPGNEGLYFCGRSVQLPRLQFTFGEMNFYLEMEDYIQMASSGAFFVVEITPAGSLGALAQSWVLGGTLLKKFYSSYEVSRAVVLYCVEGTTCDQNGTTTTVPGESVLASSPMENGSVANEADSPAVTMPIGPIGGDNPSTVTSGVTALPSETNSNTSTIVSTSNSGERNSHALTITVIASLAGAAFVVLVVLVVRKFYRKRRCHQQESLVGLEMETIAESTYASGAALTPTAAPK